MSFNCKQEINTLQEKLSLQMVLKKENSPNSKPDESGISSKNRLVLSKDKTEKEIYQELLMTYLVHKAGLSKNVGQTHQGRQVNKHETKLKDLKLKDPVVQSEN